MAAVTIWSPPKIKSVTVSIVPPSICHEVMGPDAMILGFWMSNYKPVLLLKNQNAFVNKVCVCVSSVMSDFVTPWAVNHQAPLSMEFTGVGCHYLLSRIFLTQGWNPCLLPPALAGRFFTTAPPEKPHGKIGVPRWRICLPVQEIQ